MQSSHLFEESAQIILFQFSSVVRVVGLKGRTECYVTVPVRVSKSIQDLAGEDLALSFVQTVFLALRPLGEDFIGHRRDG